MSFHPIDILPAVLLILFVYKSKLIAKTDGMNEGYLSIPTSKAIRGILAIVVVFHHLAQKTTVGLLFQQFEEFGFLAVSMFFFLSGYGLQRSHIKSEKYKKNFILHRIPQVLFPYIIVSVLFWLMYAWNGQPYSVKDFAVSIINGKPLVLFSWYIINILIFYTAYWFLMLLCRKKYFIMIIGAALWYGIYAVFCYKMGWSAYWYSSSHLIVFGMFWATYEDKILEFIKKRYALILSVSLILFLVLFIIKVYYSKSITIKVIPFLLTMTVSVLFALCVILYSLRVKFGNRILEFLGNCSLEIYLAQGLFIAGLRGSKMYIENDLLWALVTVAGSVAIGFVLHLGFSKIMHVYRKLLKIE